MIYIKLFVDYLDAIEPLGDAERGRLFTALLEYARTGEAPQLGGNERFIFPMMKAQIDRDQACLMEEQARLHDARSSAGKLGGLAKASKPKQSVAKASKAGKPKQTLANVAKDKDKDEDEDKDEDKDKDDIQEAYASCTEPPAASAPPPVIALPLNDGTEYAISEEQCQEWAGLYPAVDVIQQLRNMKGWLSGNPTRRKTRRGIVKFITGWLAKEQDRGPSRKSGGARPGGSPPGDNTWMKKYIQDRDKGG